MFPKAGRTRLTGDAYRQLVEAVYRRDHWRCRRCGARQHLSPHHLVKRSTRRLDTQENLLTLCIRCHNAVEAHTLDTIGEDANGIVTFRPRVSSELSAPERDADVV